MVIIKIASRCWIKSRMCPESMAYFICTMSCVEKVWIFRMQKAEVIKLSEDANMSTVIDWKNSFFCKHHEWAWELCWNLTREQGVDFINARFTDIVEYMGSTEEVPICSWATYVRYTRLTKPLMTDEDGLHLLERSSEVYRTGRALEILQLDCNQL